MSSRVFRLVANIVIFSIIFLIIAVCLIIGNYGWGLFLFIPFSIGYIVAVQVNKKNKRAFIFTGIGLAILAVIGELAMVFFMGIEGIICILMSLGIFLGPTIIGAGVGAIVRWIGWRLDRSNVTFASLILVSALISVNDYYNTEPYHDVVVTVSKIEKPREEIWQHLHTPIQFQPTGSYFLEKGVTHPKNMHITEIQGENVIVCETPYEEIKLPILVDSNYVIRFVLKEDFVPMKEVSLYEEVDAPHLTNYFKLKYGQFELIEGPQNQTFIKTTTAFHYKLAPHFYWRIWTNYLIDEMHQHVIDGIRQGN